MDQTLSLAQRCRKIDLLVLDVDGVLTDGRIVYDDRGVELKFFHVRDGTALKMWRQAGKRAAVISGRSSQAVAARAAELGLAPVLQGISDKCAGFSDILAQTRHDPHQACYIGDDLPDLPVLAGCGLAVAVADACAEVHAIAHYHTRAPGGHGAVREVVELLLRCQARWEPESDHLSSPT